MSNDISVFMKALTPVCVPASKTAEFLSRLDTESLDRSTCQKALHDSQSSTWVSGRPCRVAAWYFIKRHLVNEG